MSGKILERMLVISIIMYIIFPLSGEQEIFADFAAILMVCVLYIRCQINRIDKEHGEEFDDEY